MFKEDFLKSDSDLENLNPIHETMPSTCHVRESGGGWGPGHVAVCSLVLLPSFVDRSLLTVPRNGGDADCAIAQCARKFVCFAL